VAALLSFVFSAVGITVLLTAGVLWTAARPGSRHPRRFVLLVASFYLLISIYGITFQFERWLVRGYHPFGASDVPRGRTAVVVLGSGSFTARNWDGRGYTMVDSVAAERVAEAARVFRLIDPAWVISSGGPADPNSSNEPTGVAMQRALVELGVPSSRVVTETRSRNTFEEAAVIKPLLQQLGAEQVVLVTSGRHMRRSVGAFRAAGIAVVPAIARNAYLDRSWREWWLPTDSGIWEAGLVAHEFAGLAAYAATGRYEDSR
jgi:uncharacterized SAM-binding protein YcdF (DUF218 family)